MKLLVVEDYFPIRKAVEATLRESGYAVDCAGDGLEGYSARNPIITTVLLSLSGF